MSQNPHQNPEPQNCLWVGSIAFQIAALKAGAEDRSVLRRPADGVVACTHCGTSGQADQKQVEDWGRSPVDHGHALRVCSECAAGMIEPTAVITDEWGNRMGDDDPGQEAYASQFAGASTTFLIFPPNVTQGRLALPDHSDAFGSVVHVGDEAIVYEIYRI